MKLHWMNFSFRLAFFMIVAIEGLANRSTASEFDRYRFDESAFTVNCFADNSTVALVSKPAIRSWGCPISGWVDSLTETIQHSRWGHFSNWNLWNAAPRCDVRNDFVVNSPEPGKPPVPTAITIASDTLPGKPQEPEFHNRGKVGPYSLSVRDWRFGNYGCAVRDYQITADDAIPEYQPTVAITREPELSDVASVLEKCMERLEEVQCRMVVALDSCQFMSNWSESIHRRWAQAESSLMNRFVELVGNSATFLDRESSPGPLRPLFTEPQFVVYELEDGRYFLIGADQAREWNLVQPFPAWPEETSAQENLVHTDSQGGESVDYQVLSKCPVWQTLHRSMQAMFDRGWQTVELRTHQVSGWWGRWSQVRTALTESSDLR